jgi:hypothetical protein
MGLCDTASASLGVGFTAHDQECLDEIDLVLREYGSTHVDSDDESQDIEFISHGSSEVPTSFELPGSAGSSRTLEAPWDVTTSFNFSGDTTSRPVSPLNDAYSYPVDRNGTISPYIAELPKLDTAGPSSPPNTQHLHGENTAITPGMSQTDAPQATMQCDECPKVFKGKAIYLASNRQRHKREKHSKKPLRKIACSEPGCPKTFSRGHNLAVHLRSVHNRV